MFIKLSQVVPVIYHLVRVLVFSDNIMEDNQLDDSPSESDQELQTLCKNCKSYSRLKDASKKLRAPVPWTRESLQLQDEMFWKHCNEWKNQNHQDFNSLACWDKQTIYLSGLISVEISRRRPRYNNEGEACFSEKTFKYKVRVMKDNNLEEVLVCQKAFLSLHGISKKKIRKYTESSKGNRHRSIWHAWQTWK